MAGSFDEQAAKRRLPVGVFEPSMRFDTCRSEVRKRKYRMLFSSRRAVGQAGRDRKKNSSMSSWR